MMTLREMQVLVQVSELGGITNAAAAQRVAQSAISRQIAELEAKVGGPLFHRTGRGLLPTELAQSILPRARSLLAEVRQFSDDVKERAGMPSGDVAVGLVSGVAAPLASRLVRRLAEELPHIRLSIHEGFSGQVESWLANARIDVGVLNRYRSAREIRFQPLFQADLMLIGAAGSRHVKAREIEFAALADVPLVETVTPHNFTHLLAEMSRKQGVELQIGAHSDSGLVIRDLIAHAGLHATMPSHAVTAELAAGKFRAARIVDPAVRQRVVMATSTHRPLGVAGRQVANVLLELGKTLIPG